MKKRLENYRPLFSNNTEPSEKLMPADDKSLTQDTKNAEILNIYFPNAVKNLKIAEFEEVDSFAEKYHIQY